MMNDMRPCLVQGKKALFHMWIERSDIVPPSIMKGGHSGGVVKGVLALVELEDGSVGEVYPNEIKFLDNPFIDYCFDKEVCDNERKT